MSQTSSRFLRALRDLLIAMINATLILVALCLFLGLRLSDRVETAASRVAENVVNLDPLREDVQGMTGEISGLRADLAAIREGAGGLGSEAGQAVLVKLDMLDARLDAVGDRVGAVRERLQTVEIEPKALVEHAIQTASAEIVQAAGLLTGCDPSSAEPRQSLGAAPDTE